MKLSRASSSALRSLSACTLRPFGAVAEQRLGAGEPALGAQAPQPAPQHQVGEDDVARARHALPQRAADAPREHGQQHPERDRQREQRRLAPRHDHPHGERREDDDEGGRDQRHAAASAPCGARSASEQPGSAGICSSPRDPARRRLSEPGRMMRSRFGRPPGRVGARQRRPRWEAGACVRGRLAGVLVAFLVGGALLPGASKAQDDGPDGEVVALLQELIQTNTSNPPGNEAQIAELLKARLAPLGFEVEIVPTPTPGKAHFIARLRAQNPTEKPLLLAGHEDVVGVERDLWTRRPVRGPDQGRPHLRPRRDGLQGRPRRVHRGRVADRARQGRRSSATSSCSPRPTRRAATTARAGSPRRPGRRSTPASRSTRAAGSSRTAAARRA